MNKKIVDMQANHTTHTDAGETTIKLKELVGSGEKIGLLALPFLVVGVILNILVPAEFSVGGPSTLLSVISILVLIPGVTVWIWSVVLILTRVPQRKLITDGPYALARHPLYTGVAFLVLPWAGFLLNTWLGLVFGIVIYIGSRLFSPDEDAALSKTFGAAWAKYNQTVLLPWL